MGKDSRIRGGHMHDTGAAKLDPNEPGVNQLPDGKIALSEQVVRDIAEQYAERQRGRDE